MPVLQSFGGRFAPRPLTPSPHHPSVYPSQRAYISPAHKLTSPLESVVAATLARHLSLLSSYFTPASLLPYLAANQHPPSSPIDAFTLDLASDLTELLTEEITRQGVQALGTTTTDLSRQLVDMGLGKRVVDGLARLGQMARAAGESARPVEIQSPGLNPPLPPVPRFPTAIDPGNIPRTTISARFDLVNPYAASYARTMSLELAGKVADSVKATIRELVSSGISPGRDVYETARLIRDTIGLHSRYARAVDTFHQGLLNKGAEKAWADGQAKKYANRLRTARAKAIARTETMRAMNLGRVTSWKIAENAGLISSDTVSKEWSTGPKLAQGSKVDQSHTGPCAVCGPMDKKQVRGVDGMFELPDGRRLLTPPSHPNCRCVSFLVPDPVVVDWGDGS